MEWKGTGPGLSLAIKLSQLRGAVRVGIALSDKYPTEAAWEAAMVSQEFQETMDALGAILDDIHTDLTLAGPDMVVETVLKHHGRSLEALELLAEDLEVPAEDILVVLSS